MKAADLLKFWEAGRGQSHARRALILLALACRETTLEELARWSIGLRDARLLLLRESLFGSHLASLARCPQCEERLELNFEIASIRAGTGAPTPERLTVEADGFEVQFRLPNSEDLIAVEEGGDAAFCRELLLRRCLIDLRSAGRTGAIESLPEPVVAAILEKMEAADPQANTQLDLICFACRHRWLAAFDIAAFLWAEIDDWARRILREVHLLARAYGWREADILAMSAARRRAYLEMLGQV
jgi:hypothetical protein